MATALFTPILNDRTRAPHFFNGRLLTGEAMTDEQRAQHVAHVLLARGGLGDGVAYGLEVALSKDTSDDRPVVAVKAGAAVSRRGDLLLLHDDTNVELVRPATPTTTGPRIFDACRPAQPGPPIFEPCTPPQQGTYVADDGVYLLTIAPVTVGDGLATVAGLGRSGSCNVKYRIDAIQFRLVQLPVDREVIDDSNRMRNRIAYACFGVDDAAAFARDPLGVTEDPQTLLDQIDGTSIGGGDVPLAVMYWTATGGIRFVDTWAVRRRLARSKRASAAWAPADTRLAVADAMLFQFEEHLAGMAGSGLLTPALAARTCFRYLPPAGLVPLQATGKRGADVTQFFAGKTTRGPMHISGAALEALLRVSAQYPPVDLEAEEMIWLYYCDVNISAANAAGTGATRPQPYVVFCNGHIPYLANARFDLARWDYANYALVSPPV
jgi:hypothetical protein